MNTQNILQELRGELDRLEEERERVEAAISFLETDKRKLKKGLKKRKHSAATRQRISSFKKNWWKEKKQREKARASSKKGKTRVIHMKKSTAAAA